MSPFFYAHDNAQMKFDTASWLYEQTKIVDENKLRPNILIHLNVDYVNIVHMSLHNIPNIADNVFLKFVQFCVILELLKILRSLLLLLSLLLSHIFYP